MRGRRHIEGVATTEPDHDRPRTREECKDGVRPCPYVSCRHHLYLSVNEKTGHIKSHFSKTDLNVDPEKLSTDDDAYGFDHMTETCSLDVADKGAHTQKKVASTMNSSQQLADLIERSALVKVKRKIRV